MAMSGFSSGGTGGRRRAFTPMSEINVTPMVDVMLVLLVIFVITAPLLTTGVNVNLPQSRAKSLPQDDTPYQIAVQRDGTLTL
ncbi:MAG: biopolymer transporter ExbD, partial [Rhodospirillaceae bacterium]